MALWFFCAGVFLVATVHGVDLKCPTVCQCFGDATVSYTVNCTERGLRTVPNSLPSYATTLLLGRNAIRAISPPQLDGLDALVHLDVSNNGLHTLTKGSFRDLSALQVLEINHNSLNFSSEVTADCFEPLSRLRVIDIRWNMAFGDTYPQQLWRYLPNLESIRMDGIYGSLGDGFRNLTELSSLSFQGARCDISVVDSSSFSDLKNSPLNKLDIEKCGITMFNVTAFQFLSSLTWLSVASNPLYKNVLDMAAGLKYTSIQHLDLNETNIGSYVVPLFKDKLCNIGLKWLSVANNTLYGFNQIMSQCFPDLEVFSFGNNCVFEYTDDVLDLLNMPSIVFLNMSYQYHYSNSSELKQIAPSRIVGGHICEQGEACPLSLPPHLEVIDMSYYGLHLPSIPSLVIMSVCRLRRLLLAQTGLTGILGYMKCRYNNMTLEEIDLTRNRITTFNEEFFAYCDFSSMRKLLLSGNVLASELTRQGDKPFFHNLTGLEILDLSSNGLVSMDRAILHSNRNLTVVSLANNELSDFDIDVPQLKELKYLDLTNNSISCLSQVTLSQMEQILPYSEVRVNLRGNKLQCSCDCLDFYTWMSNHKSVFADMEFYMCTFSDGTPRAFDDFSVVLQRLQGECSSKLWMIIPLLVNAVIMVVIATIALLYRWRFSLETMWYRPRSSIDEEDTVYAFDSFVGYNRHDLNWVQTELCRNLELDRTGHQAVEAGIPASQDVNRVRLCCHHRDFLIGVHIFDNISEAFEKSRTTLMVVSNAALRGDWWQMELRLAVQTAAARRNNSLLFVFLEPLEGRLVTTQIRRILNTYTCERWWPGDRERQQRLWQKLRLAMKFPSRNGLTQER